MTFSQHETETLLRQALQRRSTAAPDYNLENQVWDAVIALERDELQTLLQGLEPAELRFIARLALHTIPVVSRSGMVGYIRWDYSLPPEEKEQILRDLRRAHARFCFSDEEWAREVTARFGRHFEDPSEALSYLFEGLAGELGRAIPAPNHPFWQTLGVRDSKEWRALPAWKAIAQVVLLEKDPSRWEAVADVALKMGAEQWKRGSRASVSSEREVPLPQGLGAVDPDATRFIQEIEDRDAAGQELDRLVARAHLTRGEHIIYSGLREGLEGEELLDYAEKQGISRPSVPVLKSRLSVKLREASTLE